MTAYNTYLPIAIQAAISAGKIILEIYNNKNDDFEIKLKADRSPLTKADRLAHKDIISYLKKTSLPVLSEEGTSISYEERKKWKLFWLVDPLDGTKEFINRNGEFTVNIALISEGVPVLGVIYIPVSQTLYWGVEGEGAFKAMNITIDKKQWAEQKIPLPLPEKHDGIVVVASRSHSNRETEEYIDKLSTQDKPVQLIMAGSSLKITLVAEGKADVYPRFAPTMEWDTAAGHAIIRSVGLEIYQAGTNQPLIYNKENLLNPWFIVQKESFEIEHK
ncbi:3'(2'),5'-bisphosphate nucleotidase CysQ [Parabacteroides sp. Marseille-P3160]|uniref:3'(2'),5'-bisphosphate nucleotidase CysQ n=1 Tax=Parabacteroides sp. Marseille-P3160 TaxID=1917887 RepID=UPI0009BC1A47|nr:3'(2'),5'-bisphosphate nucleotidase CysQ [Parabacteroides sp. Marseille-P3160]